MTSIKFSIIIPSFNSERYIATALESLVSQNYENIEVIVIDGQSRDGTLQILHNYRDVIDVLVSEPDKGQSDAFNKGFNMAHGEFFLWLNSDDLLVPDFLNQANSYLLKHPDCKWLTFNTIFIDPDTNIDFCHRGPSWNDFLMKRKGPQVDCPTSIFHRELFMESDGFDLRLSFAMDVDLWYQFLGKGRRWHRLNRYGYAFRMHQGSKTGKDGYGAPPSPEKVAQSTLLIERHGLRKSWLADTLVKLEKLLFTKPTSWLDTWRWRGKPFRNFQP